MEETSSVLSHCVVLHKASKVRSVIHDDDDEEEEEVVVVRVVLEAFLEWPSINVCNVECNPCLCIDVAN